MVGERRSRLARLLLVGLPGSRPDSEALHLVRQGVGGVVIFDRNVVSANQLATLVQRLQAEAPSHLLVAVDQEPGRVARLARLIGDTPSARELGSRSDGDVLRCGRVIGQGLARFGVNVDLAPVLDIVDDEGVIDDRSFGAEPARVARAGVAFLRGLRTAGVHAVGRHFPGHGGTRTDSHEALPIINTSLSQLLAWDLVPFQHAVRAGLSGVMVGHLLLRQIDARLPASLSPTVVQQLLREQLRFDGVAISDALEMGAIRASWDLPLATELAVRAGLDLVLIGRSHDRVPEVLDRPEQALVAGRLSWPRVEQALGRIERLKGKVAAVPREGLPPPPPPRS
jgi:beta-N-acetylhexosaminidase